ncbi:unnamed protein product [Hydatigera taeniaeformis]|uniref:Uncharacterized protein n=1 Tax=Hydatigena taeniaeformis TaxID=6205 RepID=A0A3P7G1Y0_HYDTA|nr:unnamed protein product [Hydatigera taeniaeformis]
MAKFILVTNCCPPAKRKCLHVALEQAALKGHMQIVRLLVRHGGDIDRSDEFLDPPIFAAIRGRCMPVIQYFVSFGANMEVRNKRGWTPLMLAARIGGEKMVDCLLNAGADVHATATGEKTAWSIAYERGHKAICKRISDAMGRNLDK